MAHTVPFYSHSSGHMTRLNEERGWTLGLPGERTRSVCACLRGRVCVCLCMYCISMCEKKVPDFHNGVGVQLCI